MARDRLDEMTAQRGVVERRACARRRTQGMKGCSRLREGKPQTTPWMLAKAHDA